MKRLKKELKWIILWMIPFLFMSVVSIYGYFSVADEITNTFEIGGNRIKIVEEFQPEKLQPGKIINKKVRVRNDGPNTCYVRVRVLFNDSDVGTYAHIDWNLTDWVYDATEEYYYYKKPVHTNETTTNLMTQIQIAQDIPEDMIKAVDVIVYAESYQADGFNDYSLAWKNYKKNGG